MSESQNGKGSRNRVTKLENFNKNYDEIDWSARRKSFSEAKKRVFEENKELLEKLDTCVGIREETPEERAANTKFVVRNLLRDKSLIASLICPNCNSNVQIWRNQITNKLTCHRAGCQIEVEK